MVTGGCGFIGINLVEELISRGAKVTVLDLPSADWERLPLDALQIKVDILQKKALKELPSDFDLIYHLAARTDIDGKQLGDYKVNFEGTRNLLEKATDCKRLSRFVFYSTQLVVGLFNETRFINETEPYRTNTVYGQSKIEGEKIVKEYGKTAKIPYTIIRPTSVYGSWGREPFQGFFSAIKKGRYYHVGKADNLVSWVYVKNLVDLTILCSLSDSAVNETFFGNDLFPYTMRQIVDTTAEVYKIKIGTVPGFAMTAAAYFLGIFKTLGVSVPIYPFRLKNIKANYCYDISKSLAIGYYPKYDLKKGITETLGWYAEHKEF